jgi:hypothetical protein
VKPKLRAFVVCAEWNGNPFTRELLDVDAANEAEARRIAQRTMDDDYEPGGVIVGVEERRPDGGWNVSSFTFPVDSHG